MVAAGHLVSESFLVWHRTREYDNVERKAVFRGGRNNQAHQQTPVVACRFWYELTDGFWGQFSIVNLPHLDAQHLLPKEYQHLKSMQNFAGMLEYLRTWTWSTEAGIIEAAGECRFGISILPYIIDEHGEILSVGSEYAPQRAVFATDKSAFLYLVSLAKRDLQYRGFRN